MGVIPRALAAGIVAPITEEIFFRALLLLGFLARYSPTKAVWASAILFTLVHGNLPQAAVALPVGVAFAYLFIRTGSIWPGVLSHALYNLSDSALIPGLLRLLGYIPESSSDMTSYPWPILAAGTIMLMFGAIRAYRELERPSTASLNALS